MAHIMRFAPSPTGYLHLGHVYSALFTKNIAKQLGARLLLRIEDIDQARCRPEYEQAIYDDLRWLGLEWETPVRRQSEHMDDYANALARLADMNLIYPCFCTRKDIRATHPETGPLGPIYPGLCRDLSDDQRQQKIGQNISYALRLNMTEALKITGPLQWQDQEKGPQQVPAAACGDVVIARKDSPASYHLSVVEDDHLQNISLITRGMDLFDATHIHCVLQSLLGYDTPLYHHHALVWDTQQDWKLSKRDGALAFHALKEQGKTPQDILREAEALLRF